MDLPIPDMTEWSILDFELAFDGINQIYDAAISLQNQPRASRGVGEYHPGADFIVQVGEDWCGLMLDEIVQKLRVVRFDTQQDDDRRVLLLIRYAAIGGPAGESLAGVLQMALQQSVRPAA